MAAVQEAARHMYRGGAEYKRRPAPLVTSIQDPLQTLETHYTKRYVTENQKSDSPDASRASLLSRARPHIYGLRADEKVIEFGAGRQILIRELVNSAGGVLPEASIVTVDLAHIPPGKLLVGNNERVKHYQANCAELPEEVGDNFSEAISSLAVDFMLPREKTFAEITRVLRPGAHAHFNLHHRDMIPDDIDDLVTKRNLTRHEQEVYPWWKYLKDNDVLFENADDIAAAFEPHGFTIDTIQTNSQGPHIWWEVDMRKRSVPKQPYGNSA